MSIEAPFTIFLVGEFIPSFYSSKYTASAYSMVSSTIPVIKIAIATWTAALTLCSFKFSTFQRGMQSKAGSVFGSSCGKWLSLIWLSIILSLSQLTSWKINCAGTPVYSAIVQASSASNFIAVQAVWYDNSFVRSGLCSSSLELSFWVARSRFERAEWCWNTFDRN